MRQIFILFVTQSWCCIVFVSLVLSQHLLAQELPVWSDEDRDQIEKGEFIARSVLLGGELSTSYIPQSTLDTDPPVLSEDDLGLIPEDFFSHYFTEKSNGYLIDPQRLLSQQERADLEGFLAHHAEEAKVDIRLYLLDAQQPMSYQSALQNLVQQHYSASEFTAVVFCCLGAPSRNQLIFGGVGAGTEDADEIRRMQEGALLKAMEKSDPAAQVEAFVVELSIKLYWMERTALIGEAKGVVRSAVGNEIPLAGEGGFLLVEPVGFIASVKSYLLYVIVVGVSLFLFLLGWVGVFYLWKNTRRFRFPAMDVPRRLGANYAAGVGAMIYFHDKHESPDKQRDQMPDYLTR